jgi:FAD/FMN-containing dehydrogenase
VAGQEEKALELSYRILRLCVDHGSSITGEHGVGKEKQEALGYMFAEPDLATMQLVRCAFDPEDIANPDKVFPRPRLCAEKPGPYYAPSAGDGGDRGDFLMSASAALTLEQGVAQLAAMVGEEHTRLRGEAAQTIEVAPRDMQQVAEILRFAHANALSVMPCGGSTKLGWGIHSQRRSN